MNSIKSLAIAGAVLISYACAQAAQVHPQTPPPAMQGSSLSAQSITVSGAGPRPLEQALSTLRIKYGWVLNYEDPQYLFGKDVMDDPHIKGSLIPAGTSFSAEISAPSPTDAAAEATNVEKTLQLIVDSYNRSGNPGQFELRKAEGNVISVVGVAVRDNKGAVAPQKPLLDTVVSIPAQERTISDTIDLLCKALTGETQVPVSIGITPRSLVDHTNVTAGGNKVAARTILAQTLAASGHALYWQLLFDPNSKAYLLNIHSARVPKAANQNWREKPGENPGEKQSKPPSPAPHP